MYIAYATSTRSNARCNGHLTVTAFPPKALVRAFALLVGLAKAVVALSTHSGLVALEMIVVPIEPARGVALRASVGVSASGIGHPTGTDLVARRADGPSAKELPEPIT
eukprot:COSAG04_NODE_534_length_12949_cov_5.651673_15_plen_108_part_00